MCRKKRMQYSEEIAGRYTFGLGNANQFFKLTHIRYTFGRRRAYKFHRQSQEDTHLADEGHASSPGNLRKTGFRRTFKFPRQSQKDTHLADEMNTSSSSHLKKTYLAWEGYTAFSSYLRKKHVYHRKYVEISKAIPKRYLALEWYTSFSSCLRKLHVWRTKCTQVSKLSEKGTYIWHGKYISVSRVISERYMFGICIQNSQTISERHVWCRKSTHISQETSERYTLDRGSAQTSSSIHLWETYF
jgi:hypothetical protein